MAEELQEVKEKSTNCAGCGKQLKKAKLYYRNGKHYCKIRCFKDTLKKTAETE